MVERIKMGYANCYLVSGEGGSILVDSCNYKDGEKIFKRVKDKNVKLILLTHCHFDHVSSAEYLSRRLGVPIAMSREDAHLIGNGEASILKAHTPLGRIMARFSRGVLTRATYSKFTPELWLEEGQKLSEYGVRASVVALPGHTKGSVGVLTDEGDFIVGDAVFNMLHPTGSRLYEDRETMEHSFEKIRKSGAVNVYMGHGNPIPANKLKS